MFDSAWRWLPVVWPCYALGFALVETGLCRAKKTAHTMSMNLIGLRPRLSCLLGLRLPPMVWGNVTHVP